MKPRWTDAVLARIDSYRDEIADFSRRLVAIPTPNPPGENYGRCLKAIAQELRRIGLSHREIETTAQGPSPPRCLLTELGDSGPALYFHGHYDVVPAQSSDQFEPRLERGRLHGRGSADMKSGLAAMIYAARALKELALPLEGNVRLCIVPDEETGGAAGSGHLSRRGLLGERGVGMLTAEPTSGVIWNASRGAVTLKVTARGRSAHVGLQHRGVNAFQGMLKAAHALNALRSRVERRRTRFRITPPEAAGSILMMGGRVEGGTNFNAVPAECSFTVDRRINPEEDLAAEKVRLIEALEGVRGQGVQLDWEILQEAASSATAETSPLSQALAQAAKEVLGTEPAFEMCPGILETRFYAQRGIPALAFGPGLLEVSHGPAEYVEMKAVFDCAAIYALTAASLLSA